MKKLALFFLILLSSTAFATWQHTVYAGYFYYFAKHTQYEAIKDHFEFKISVIGSTDMFSAARHMSLSKNINGTRINVFEYTSLTDCKNTHILYLDKSKTNLLTQAINFCKTNNILLVTNISGAAQKGADIEFWEDSDSNVRFSINSGACKDGHLQLSSVLFNMAKSH